jgi:hypothetical protein
MIFDEQALSKALNNVIPENKNNAVVFLVDNDGVRIAAHVTKKLDKVDWKVEGVYKHDWTGEDEVLGRIGFYW